MLRHGALVCGGQEGALQVNAQQPRAGAGAFYGLPRLVDAPQCLLLGICQNAAQPAGGSVAREKGADLLQVPGRGSVDVDAVPAVGVHIDKSRHQCHSVEVQYLGADRVVNVRAHGRQHAFLHQHVRRGKIPAPVDIGVFQKQLSHRRPLNTAAWPHWHSPGRARLGATGPGSRGKPPFFPHRPPGAPPRGANPGTRLGAAYARLRFASYRW